MLIPIEYTYLVGSLVSLIPWAFLYWYRKDLRKMILFASLFMGVYGVITEYYIWTVDWWKPPTITGTLVGIEDFITGFSVGGIISSIYLIVLNKKLAKFKARNKLLNLSLIVSLHLLALFSLVYVFSFSSYVSCVIVYTLTTLIFFILRRDLIKMSLVTGLSIVIGSIPIYALLFKLTPTFVEHTWIFERLSGILFLGIPIEDLIFFFLLGTFFAPMYFFITGGTYTKK